MDDIQSTQTELGLVQDMAESKKRTKIVGCRSIFTRIVTRTTHTLGKGKFYAKLALLAEENNTPVFLCPIPKNDA